MKNEKGSITTIVATTIFFIVLVLDALYTTTYIKSRSQTAELSTLKNAYDGDMREIYLERISDELYGVSSTASTNATNSTNN